MTAGPGTSAPAQRSDTAECARSGHLPLFKCKKNTCWCMSSGLGLELRIGLAGFSTLKGEISVEMSAMNAHHPRSARSGRGGSRFTLVVAVDGRTDGRLRYLRRQIRLKLNERVGRCSSAGVINNVPSSSPHTGTHTRYAMSTP